MLMNTGRGDAKPAKQRIPYFMENVKSAEAMKVRIPAKPRMSECIEEA
jgi:hypothetical protein